MRSCGAFALSMRAQIGSAMAETLVSLLALMPFLIGLPLLSKQADIKHKAVDAARYAVWERTVWRNDGLDNRKSAEDITLETRDRILGHPRAGLLDVNDLRSQGITENRFWRDRRARRLLEYERNPGALEQTIDERSSPVEVGYFLVPSLAYGDGPLASAASLLRVRNLDLDRRAFAHTHLELAVRAALSEAAARPPSLGHMSEQTSEPEPLRFEARGAILSDTWAVAAESEFRQRVDFVTANELIESLERPVRVLGALALGRGRPLYGEGQYAWDSELRPNTIDLPRAYIGGRRVQ